MYKREHHLRIAAVLQALDADKLAQFHCWFGGGTAIVLSHGEYRESVDVDFLVSQQAGYRTIRQLVAEGGLPALLRNGQKLEQSREIRMDQYGIRTLLSVAGTEIKFEIVLEGRIAFETPGPAEQISGVTVLTPLDLAASKLLANSDRWTDDSVFSRDLIDLAMLGLTRETLERAKQKAAQAYGESIERDLSRAVQKLGDRTGRLDECMEALKMNEVPKAVLWKKIRGLPIRKRNPRTSRPRNS